MSFFTVEQSIGITPFLSVSFADLANPKQKFLGFYQHSSGLSTNFWAPLFFSADGFFRWITIRGWVKESSSCL